MKKLGLKILMWFLKKLSQATIWRYKPMIIGVTGSVGKTSTKEALRTVFGRDKSVRAPSKNFNNELGLPLSILGNWKDIGGAFFWFKVISFSILNLIIKRGSYPEILILEYGVDAPGDMKKLLEIAKPHIGVATAIGNTPVHIEFFAGKEGIVREKTKLINALPATGFAILNADDLGVLGMKKHTRARTLTFGFSESADLRISNFETHCDDGETSITFKLNYGGGFVPVRLENILGKSQAYAAASASAAAVALGFNLVKISENLAYSKPFPGRLRMLRGIKESFIIDDTYNASPIAVEEALYTLKELKAKRKIAVLGDMLELGSCTIEAHNKIGVLASGIAKILITIGIKGKFIAEAAIGSGLPKKSVIEFNNINEAASFLKGIIEEGDLILVKGSQSVRMEKIVKEIMAEPDKARELLVRQNEKWIAKLGMYDMDFWDKKE